VWIIGVAVSNIKSLRVKVWAFNIAAILSICYHAELLFRVFGADNEIPNLYELHNRFYFNKPYLDQKFGTDEYSSRYRTNCQGFRIDEQTNADDSIKKCDWLFIGDSFTQGAQVDYEYLFTSLIYKSFPEKIIINAGISGAGLCEELNFYKEIGQKLHPKKVFLQIGVAIQARTVVAHKVVAFLTSDFARTHAIVDPRLDVAHQLLGAELHIVEYLGNSLTINHLVYLVVVFVDVDVHRIGVTEQVVQVAQNLLIGTHQKPPQIVVLTLPQPVNGQ